MNLTDLRDELTTHADDLGTTADFRAGVAAKVRTTKRRRAAAAAGAATLAVAALTVGVVTTLGQPAPSVPAGTPPSAAPMIGADGMPFRTVPDAPGDIVNDGLRFRAQVGGDHLIAGAIGSPGQQNVTTTFTVTTDRIAFSADCWLPDETPERAQRSLAWLVVDGKRTLGSTCGSKLPVGDLQGGIVPGEPGLGWDELSIGSTVTVSVEVVDRETNRPLSDGSVRVVGAAYALGSRQAVQDAGGKTVADLPIVIEHQGYRYRADALVSTPLASGPLPTTGRPAGPALVLWGSAGSDLIGLSPVESGSLRLDGLLEASEARGYGSWGMTPVPADSARTLGLVADRQRPDHGVAFIATYVLAP